MDKMHEQYKEGFNDRVDGMQYGKWFRGNQLNPDSKVPQPNVCAPHPAYYWNDEQKHQYIEGYRAADEAIKDYLRQIRKP